MNALRLDADGKEVSHGSLLAVVLQQSRLFEAFIISSYPHPPHSEGSVSLPLPPSLLSPLSLSISPDNQDWDLELLKLSHTLTIDLDAKHCSTDVSCSHIDIEHHQYISTDRAE